MSCDEVRSDQIRSGHVSYDGRWVTYLADLLCVCRAEVTELHPQGVLGLTVLGNERAVIDDDRQLRCSFLPLLNGYQVVYIRLDGKGKGKCKGKGKGKGKSKSKSKSKVWLPLSARVSA